MPSTFWLNTIAIKKLKPPNICPLCSSIASETIATQDQRLYSCCKQCKLIFLHRSQLPDAVSEKARYTQHQNTIEDSGYISFLQKVIRPVSQYITPSISCLDYGCGPSPVLAKMLARDYQLKVQSYDPFFCPIALKEEYDMIFSTEVFEHFHQPAKEIERLHQLLKKGGYLGIMTNMYGKLEEFEDWWYRRDVTHVSFYHPETFNFIAHKYGFKVCWQDYKQVIILQKT